MVRQWALVFIFTLFKQVHRCLLAQWSRNQYLGGWLVKGGGELTKDGKCTFCCFDSKLIFKAKLYCINNIQSTDAKLVNQFCFINLPISASNAPDTVIRQNKNPPSTSLWEKANREKQLASQQQIVSSTYSEHNYYIFT